MHRMGETRLEAFGVKNLRCLSDTGLVPIKPLTLLVGRNSSGKSTFLRAFPLLRQSVESPRRSPILWSHPSYVDFGSIETATNERARDQGVTFRFAARMSGAGFVGEPRCELAMTLGTGEGGARVAAYEVSVEGRSAQIVFDEDRRVTGLRVGGRDFLSEVRPLWLAGAAKLILSPEGDASMRAAYVPVVRGSPSRWQNVDGSLFWPLDLHLTTSYGISTLDMGDAARTACLGSLDATWTALREALRGRGLDPAVLGSDDRKREELADLVLLARLPDVLSSFDEVVSDFMSRVAYLGPRRAVGERQYLRSEISVDELLPRGENLPQLLASLDPARMADFARFTRESLGFEPKLGGQGLNIEILIKQAGASEHQNIADIGFGYAEVLPLCASIWLNMLASGRSPRTSLLALEQPELHLHPAHQARLARMLAAAVSTAKATQAPAEWTGLLVETHSEALVNGLGMLVRAKRLDPEDVQIVVFEQDPMTRETSLRFAGYKESGALRDWPFGFLAPVADEIDELADAAAEE